MKLYVVRMVLLLALLTLPAVSLAQARAWLDRDRIAIGETTTLNVEASGNGAPDYAPLLADFDLSGHSSRQQFEWSAGKARVRSVYTVALRPRRMGLLRIPALRTGAARTAPLVLLVTPALPALMRPATDVFVESELDDPDPYVQQSVGWVVRAHSAVPLIAYDLRQEAPEGATILRNGSDVQYRRTIGDRTYTVIERRFTLVPERSGVLTLPSARFDGRGIGGMFDRLFGDGEAAVSAMSKPRRLVVQPIPPNAPQPWLPLHSLTLRYLLVPGPMQAGVASTVVVEAEADGVGAAQMPELAFPPLAGVQVFGERVASDESIVEGRPRVRLTRRFSIVPSQAGSLRLPGPSIGWWDVRTGRARTTTLPAIEQSVAPGVAPEGPVDTPEPASADQLGPSRKAWRRPLLAVAALLALGLLAWAASRRRGIAWSGRPSPAPGGTTPPEPAPARTSLARLLELGDLADIEAALRDSAPGDSPDLDTVIELLESPEQRDAVAALRRARWASGDSAAAREALRRAFAGGIRWKVVAPPPRGPLPPLYPDR